MGIGHTHAAYQGNCNPGYRGWEGMESADGIMLIWFCGFRAIASKQNLFLRGLGRGEVSAGVVLTMVMLSKR